MKKYILFLTSLMFVLSSCHDDKDAPGSINCVTEAGCTPFIGSVVMTWKNPVADNYYYTLVTYRDADGNTINRKVSRFNADGNGVTTTTIGGFSDTDEYTFVLRAYGYDGATSAPVTVKCAPQDISGAAAYVLSTANVEGNEFGAELTWANETGVGVWLNMSYVNELGVLMEERIDATESGSFAVLDMPIGETTFTVYAENKADEQKTPAKTFKVASAIDPADVFRIWFDPSRTEPVNFDFEPVGITYQVVGTDHYALTLDASAAERYIISEPLGGSLRRNDMVLTFQYRCSDNFGLTLLYYPFEWATLGDYYSDKGLLPLSNEWRTVSFSISNDIEKLKWGTNPNSQIRFIFTNGNIIDKTAHTLFEIRNIQLRPGK